MRTVMIATPTYDGKVHVRYLDSLLQTVRAAPADIGIFPVYIPGDALVQRARNSLCGMALAARDGTGVDDVVFIDADIGWKAEDFFRLLSHSCGIVGGAYRQKRDDTVLVYRPRDGEQPNDEGLLAVEAIGCGFLRISGEALKRLWDDAAEYRDGPVTMRAIFECRVERGELLSEDIAMCRRWTALGGSIYLDTRIECDHIGERVYRIGDKA